MLKLSILAGATALLAAGAFHLELKSSVPVKDTLLASSPKTVTLTFSEEVNAKLAAISILRPDSTEVEKLVVSSVTKDPASIQGVLKTTLTPGRYLVRWRASSDDGHVVRQVFGFSVAGH
jgi:methionine-rich copper-binding protein CopC